MNRKLKHLTIFFLISLKKKFTGETPEVRSNKRKPKEKKREKERERREKEREKREKEGK